MVVRRLKQAARRIVYVFCADDRQTDWRRSAALCFSALQPAALQDFFCYIGLQRCTVSSNSDTRKLTAVAVILSAVSTRVLNTNFYRVAAIDLLSRDYWYAADPLHQRSYTTSNPTQLVLIWMAVKPFAGIIFLLANSACPSSDSTGKIVTVLAKSEVHLRETEIVTDTRFQLFLRRKGVSRVTGELGNVCRVSARIGRSCKKGVCATYVILH